MNWKKKPKNKMKTTNNQNNNNPYSALQYRKAEFLFPRQHSALFEIYFPESVWYHIITETRKHRSGIRGIPELQGGILWIISIRTLSSSTRYSEQLFSTLFHRSTLCPDPSMMSLSDSWDWLSQGSVWEEVVSTSSNSRQTIMF